MQMPQYWEDLQQLSPANYATAISAFILATSFSTEAVDAIQRYKRYKQDKAVAIAAQEDKLTQTAKSKHIFTFVEKELCERIIDTPLRTLVEQVLNGTVPLHVLIEFYIFMSTEANKRYGVTGDVQYEKLQEIASTWTPELPIPLPIAVCGNEASSETALCTSNYAFGPLPRNENYIYGRALNAWNENCSVGGFGGSAAALVSSGGTLLGIAHRSNNSALLLGGIVSAHFNGACALRVASPIVPKSHDTYYAPRADDIAFYLSKYKSIEYAQPPSPKQYTIGYYIDDAAGYDVPTSCVKRTVQQSIEALQKRGHKVVPFVPPVIEKSYFWYLSQLANASDQGFYVKDEVQELFNGNAKGTWQVLRFVNSPFWLFLRPIVKYSAAFIAKFIGATVLSKLIANVSFGAALHQQDLLRAEFQTAMEKAQVDIVLGPCASQTALTHGNVSKSIFKTRFGIWPEVIDYPAAAIPVTHIQLGEEGPLENVGLPSAVQLVTSPGKESDLVDVMLQLDKEFAWNANRGRKLRMWKFRRWMKVGRYGAAVTSKEDVL